MKLLTLFIYFIILIVLMVIGNKLTMDKDPLIQISSGGVIAIILLIFDRYILRFREVQKEKFLA